MTPRKLLRIARWEVTKNAGGVDRRTVAVLAVGLVLFAAVVPLVASGGVGLDEGIYTVGVDEDSEYYDVAEADDTFRIREGAGEAALRRGEIDVLVLDGRPYPADTRKGRAAYEAFRESVQQYNNERLADEANRTAAFPVDVTVNFRERNRDTVDRSAGGGGSPSPGDGSGSDDGTPSTDPGDGEPSDDPDDGTGTDGGATGGSGGDGSGGTADPEIGRAHV